MRRGRRPSLATVAPCRARSISTPMSVSRSATGGSATTKRCCRGSRAPTWRAGSTPATPAPSARRWLVAPSWVWSSARRCRTATSTGFGRRAMDVAAPDLEADVLYQLSAVDGLSRLAGSRVAYLKPHGALLSPHAGRRRAGRRRRRRRDRLGSVAAGDDDGGRRAGPPCHRGRAPRGERGLRRPGLRRRAGGWCPGRSRARCSTTPIWRPNRQLASRRRADSTRSASTATHRGRQPSPQAVRRLLETRGLTIAAFTSP